MKNSTQRTSCVHNSKKSGSLSGIMQLSMAILFAFSITTQAEAIEYPSAKVQTAINQQSKIKITGTVVDQAGIPIIGANITVKKPNRYRNDHRYRRPVHIGSPRQFYPFDILYRIQESGNKNHKQQTTYH